MSLFVGFVENLQVFEFFRNPKKTKSLLWWGPLLESFKSMCLMTLIRTFEIAEFQTQKLAKRKAQIVVGPDISTFLAIICGYIPKKDDTSWGFKVASLFLSSKYAFHVFRGKQVLPVLSFSYSQFVCQLVGLANFQKGLFSDVVLPTPRPLFGYFWLRTFKTWCIRTLPRNWWFSRNDYITNRQAPQTELRSDSPCEYAVAMVGKDDRKDTILTDSLKLPWTRLNCLLNKLESHRKFPL